MEGGDKINCKGKHQATNNGERNKGEGVNEGGYRYKMGSKESRSWMICNMNKMQLRIYNREW